MREDDEGYEGDELQSDDSPQSDDDVEAEPDVEDDTNVELDIDSKSAIYSSPVVRHYHDMQLAYESPMRQIRDYVSTYSRDVMRSVWPAIQIRNAAMSQISYMVDDNALFENAGLKKFIQAQISSSKTLNYDILADRIGKNLELNFSLPVLKNMARFAEIQNSWLKSLTPAIKRAVETNYPQNLQGIEGKRFDDVKAVVMTDGIALYGVPARQRAASILMADTWQKRRAFLGNNWQALTQDCREALEDCSAPEIQTYLRFANAAIDAMESNNPQAAQALSASIIDSFITEYFGGRKKSSRYKPNKKGTRTTEFYFKDFHSLELIALAPMWSAYQAWDPDEDEPIPRKFSRHATAHTVSTQQYSRRNAVQALMFASSLLLWWDHVNNIPAT